MTNIQVTETHATNAHAVQTHVQLIQTINLASMRAQSYTITRNDETTYQTMRYTHKQ